jgi:hypothetical protein
MTHHELEHWLADLERCPAAAVENPLLLQRYQQDPAFFTTLCLRQRWQLLAGLHITLLDYTSASYSPMGLEAERLPLPVRQLTIPLAQLIDALTVADFALDQVAWDEELALQLSEPEQAACDQVLAAPQIVALLHTLLSRGLAFLANCDLSKDSQI